MSKNGEGTKHEHKSTHKEGARKELIKSTSLWLIQATGDRESFKRVGLKVIKASGRAL